MKNKKKFIISYLIIFFFSNIAFSSEEINYSSNTIKILENGKIIFGEGDVQILIGENIFIRSETFEYNKETGLYKIFNNVQFKDKINNIKASGSEFILSTFDNKILSKTKCTADPKNLNFETRPGAKNSPKISNWPKKCGQGSPVYRIFSHTSIFQLSGSIFVQYLMEKWNKK